MAERRGNVVRAGSGAEGLRLRDQGARAAEYRRMLRGRSFGRVRVLGSFLAARWPYAVWYGADGVGLAVVGAGLVLAFAQLWWAGALALGWVLGVTWGVLRQSRPLADWDSRMRWWEVALIMAWLAPFAFAEASKDQHPTDRVLAWAVLAGLLGGAASGLLWPSDRDDRAAEPVEPPSEPNLRLARALLAEHLGPADAGLDARVAGCDGWDWIPCRDLVLIIPPPAAVTVEQVDGPAVRWPDGAGECWWHGVPVPDGALTGSLTGEQIDRIDNTESRRAAIEIIGWPEYVRRAGYRLLSTVPDPGNPGQELQLYDPPERLSGRGRLLVMTNGSPDRDGTDRVYAEHVPPFLDDPVEAAAWQYDVPVDVYRTLQRRS